MGEEARHRRGLVEGYDDWDRDKEIEKKIKIDTNSQKIEKTDRKQTLRHKKRETLQ